MNASAEFAAGPEAHHADLVAVLLAEECHRPELPRFGERYVAVFVERQIFADEPVDESLDAAKLLVGHFLKVREVEAQRRRVDVRSFLLDVVAQHLFQRIVEQMRGRVVGCAGIPLLHVDASHEFGLQVFRKFAHDVNALVVLALCVENSDGLIVVHKRTLVAHLSAHFAVERRSVEHEFEVETLLLCHFSVAEDMATVFRMVVADEFLFAISDDFPISVLHCSGVARARLLLGHFLVETLFIYGVTVFAANQLGQIERKAVGVEQSKGADAVKFAPSVCFQLVHVTIEEVYALFQCAKKGIFLFFHHAADEFLLRRKFGVSLPHFVHQNRQEPV